MEPLNQTSSAGSIVTPPPAPAVALTTKADSLLAMARDLATQLDSIDERLFGRNLASASAGTGGPEASKPALETTLDRISASMKTAANIADKLSARL
jgi:hypothetical protein